MVSKATFWILCAFNPMSTLGKEKALLELQLSYLANQLVPVLYLAFLFSWIWTPILFLTINRSGKRRFRERFFQLRSIVHDFSTSQNGSLSGGTKVKRHTIGSRIILLSSLLIGIFFAYYPYFHGPSWLVGTDTYWRYLDPLQKTIESENSWRAAFQERHPAYLLILLGLKTITSSSSFLVVKFMPMFSILLLALATFWLVKISTNNEYLGAIASVFSVLSITTTEGIYTGILANWFTLVLWALFFVFLFKASNNEIFREKSRKVQLMYFSILAVLSLGIFFVHPWTWGVFMAVFICYMGLTFLRDRSVDWKTGVMGISILLLNIGSAILSVFLLSKVQGWRLVEALSTYEWSFQHPESLFQFGDVLNFIVKVWSAFLSPLFFFLAVVGMVFVTTRRGKIGNLVISWTAVASVGSILAAPLGYSSDFPTHTELIRMLFITPFQIPAAIGLCSILNVIKQSLSHSGDGKSTRRIASSHLLALAFLMSHYAILSQLFLTGHLALGLISMLVLNFAVVTVLVIYFKGSLQVFATSLIVMIVVLSLVNFCFNGLSSLLTDPRYYRP